MVGSILFFCSSQKYNDKIKKRLLKCRTKANRIVEKRRLLEEKELKAYITRLVEEDKERKINSVISSALTRSSFGAGGDKGEPVDSKWGSNYGESRHHRVNSFIK